MEFKFETAYDQKAVTAMAKAIVTFHAEDYRSETEIGSSDFKYGTIWLLAETADYRQFIKGVTGKEIQHV